MITNIDVETALRTQMNLPFDLLLGRKTFESWAQVWPQHADEWGWPGVNTATKYVASNTMKSSEWKPSVFLNGDIAEKVAKIKGQQGPDLHVRGSGNLIQTLLKHDLIDAFWLVIYPITLASGKRLFADGTIPLAFKVTESIVGSSGALVMKYEHDANRWAALCSKRKCIVLLNTIIFRTLIMSRIKSVHSSKDQAHLAKIIAQNIHPIINTRRVTANQ